MSDTDATQVRQDVAADVDEILEHVINGNMPSMPYDVYVELFDAVAGLGVEIENLQAENAKLRETLQRRNKQFEGMTEAWVERGVENAKLRELVRQMHPRAKAFLQMGVQLGCNDTLSYDWELQMRELGIEVDDA